jgi:tripartite-type tricarboxylate transporter receptor subunit TctC
MKANNVERYLGPIPMKNSQLRLVLSVALTVTLAALSGGAQAQDRYPSRPIEIIVPTPPGGGTDLVFRRLAELVEPILGQKVVVVNKPGGGGVLGMAAVTSARPDGYTLAGVVNSPLTMVPHMQPAPYGPNDYVAISLADSSPGVMCAKADFPAKDAKDLIEHLKKNAGKYTYGNDGVGGNIHLAFERVFFKVGVKLRPVPFGGAGETLKNFLGGHIDFFGGSVSTILPYVKDGTAKCLLVMGTDRLNSLPNSMTLADIGLSDQATLVWHGLVGPKAMASDRVALLEKAFMQAASSEKFRKDMEPRGLKIEASSSADFRKLIDSEYKAMGELMMQLGLAKK